MKSKVRPNSESEYYHPSRSRKVNSEKVINWSPIDQKILDEIFLKSNTVEIYTLENRIVGKVKVVRYDEFSNSKFDEVLQRMPIKVTIIFIVFFCCMINFRQNYSSETINAVTYQ